MNPDIERLREQITHMDCWLSDQPDPETRAARAVTREMALTADAVDAALDAANDRASEAQEALYYIRDEVLDGALIALEQTRAALRKYGWHDIDCPAIQAVNPGECSCGFDTALAAAPERQDAEEGGDRG